MPPLPRRALYVVLPLAALLSYANAFGGPFVFDDLDNITNNTHIRQLWPLSEALGAPPQSAVAGRPFVALTLALNYALGGLSPVGYHALNLLVHALNALLVFAALERLLGLPRVPERLRSGAFEIAAATALLWVVHPLHSETIDYVIQRTESLAGLWYLAAVYASVRAFETPRAVRWLLIATVSACLGMASKETVATLPVMVLLLDAVCVSGSPARAVKARPLLYAGLASSWLVLAGLIIGGPRFRSAGFSSGVSPLDYLLNQGEMIATYLRLVFWPDPLLLDYGLTTPVTAGRGALFVAAVALLLAGAVVALRWRPLVGLAGLWFFICLAPASSVIPIATEVGAERRMYLALLGVISLLAGSAWQFVAVRFGPHRRRVWTAAVVAVSLALGARTLARNADYRDPLDLWAQVVERRPHARAHYNLGIELEARGSIDEAIAHYRAAGDLPEALYALGFEMAKAGNHQGAIDEYRRFLSLSPDNARAPQAQILLGRSLSRIGRLPEALVAFNAALAMTPRATDAVLGRADTLAAMERWSEAADSYQHYVTLVPGSAGGFSSLGRMFVALDQAPAAVRAFERAVELEPRSTAHVLNYGYALISAGRADEAGSLYERTLTTAPQNAALLSALGVARVAQGRREEAQRWFERALQLEPSNPQIHADMRMALGTNTVSSK